MINIPIRVIVREFIPYHSTTAEENKHQIYNMHDTVERECESKPHFIYHIHKSSKVLRVILDITWHMAKVLL